MARVYSRSEVERGLIKKGFVLDHVDHRRLRFTPSGKPSHIWTKLSHGRGGKDVGTGLLKRMAEQCALSLSDFCDLVDCPLEKEEYEAHLTNHLAHNRLPWPRGTRVITERTETKSGQRLRKLATGN